MEIRSVALTLTVTSQCPYLNNSNKYKTMYAHTSYTDLSPVPVRSAAKSYLTSCLAQNLSKRVLKRLTVFLTSTTWLGIDYSN